MARKLEDRPENNQVPPPASPVSILDWDEGGASTSGWLGVEIQYRERQLGEHGRFQRPTLRVVIDHDVPPKP